MGMGAQVYFSKTIASAATLSAEFDLGRSWENVFLQIPSMTSNSQIHIQVSEVTGGTYRRVFHPTLNSATPSTTVFAIASAATSCNVPIPGGFRYMKVETTATMDSGETFKIVCGD